MDKDILFFYLLLNTTLHIYQKNTSCIMLVFFLFFSSNITLMFHSYPLHPH